MRLGKKKEKACREESREGSRCGQEYNAGARGLSSGKEKGLIALQDR